MLEVVDQFHSQIELIDRAKIPLTLYPNCKLSIVEQLASLRKLVLTPDGEFRSLEQAIASGQVPTNYRVALELWLRGDRQRALDQLSARAENRRYIHQSVQFVALQVTLILAGVFVGLLATCVWLYPKVEAFHEPHRNAPGNGLRLLETLRNFLPVWGIAVPLLVMTLWVFWKRGFVRARNQAMSAESVWLSELGAFHRGPSQFRVWTGIAMIVCGLSVLSFGICLFWPAVELLLQVSEPSR